MWDRKLGLLLSLSFMLTPAVAVEPATADSAGREIVDSAPNVEIELSDRRLRSEGFASALPQSTELELWVDSPIVADLIAEAYATAYDRPRTGMTVPTVPYLAARLVTDSQGETRLSFLYPGDGTRQDIDRLERCFAEPLRRSDQRLPCDQPGSGCWRDLGEQSAKAGTHLFPLQLGIFLESAGYSVKINGHRLEPLLESLGTGRMQERQLARIIMTYVPPEPEPEFPWVRDDIRLLPCEPVEE